MNIPAAFVKRSMSRERRLGRVALVDGIAVETQPDVLGVETREESEKIVNHNELLDSMLIYGRLDISPLARALAASMLHPDGSILFDEIMRRLLAIAPSEVYVGSFFICHLYAFY